MSELIKNQEELKTQNLTILSDLGECSVLTNADIKSLAEAKDFILDNFTKVPMYRPLPVKLFGVLNDKDHPTPESKFWQCKVEAEVHADQLIIDMHELEDMKIALEKGEYVLERMIEKQSHEDDSSKKTEIGFDIRSQKISNSRVYYRIMTTMKRIKYRIEEITEWKKICTALEKSNTFNATDYVVQYTNTLKHKLIEKIKAEPEETKKQEYQSQITAFDNILNIFK